MTEDFDEQIEVFQNYSFRPSAIFLNKTDVASQFQDEELNQSGNWHKNLQKYYGEFIPIIEGSALNALESPNINTSKPEYQPIIELIQAIDIKK